MRIVAKEKKKTKTRKCQTKNVSTAMVTFYARINNNNKPLKLDRRTNCVAYAVKSDNELTNDTHALEVRKESRIT